MYQMLITDNKIAKKRSKIYNLLKILQFYERDTVIYITSFLRLLIKIMFT